jgi:hypothetical protein
MGSRKNAAGLQVARESSGHQDCKNTRTFGHSTPARNRGKISGMSDDKDLSETAEVLARLAALR